jgi:hypothetical protein
MKIKADPNWVLAIAISMAINGDMSLLEKLQQDAIELWNGFGI